MDFLALAKEKMKTVEMAEDLLRNNPDCCFDYF